MVLSKGITFNSIIYYSLLYTFTNSLLLENLLTLSMRTSFIKLIGNSSQ